MKTAQQIRKEMVADKRLTPSRSRSHRRHRNYSNPYTRAMTDYDGINSKGYFTKFYPYGTVGHCCIFVQAHLIWAGYGKLVPHKGYIWNTNNYAKWLKSEPTIKGLGKVKWTASPAKASKAANAGKLVVVFKGRLGSDSYTHTCVLLKVRGNYIYTVDGNVNGWHKGKRINNGVLKKRRARNYRWGFAILPIPTKVKGAPYTAGHVYTLQKTMNLRKNHSTKSKKVGTMKKGKRVAPLSVYKTTNGAWWLKVPHKGELVWVCGKTAKNLYVK